METLGNPGDPRDHGAVNGGQAWVDGWQAARLLGPRADHDPKQTKHEKFLSEIEAVVPWQALIVLIEPHYPKTSKKGGRPPYPLST